LFFDRYIGKKRLLVVMSNTGNEHDQTYRHVKRMQRLLKEHNIDFYFLDPSLGFHSDTWQDLVSFYKRTGTIGSKAYPKTCTDNLKIKVIYRFLDEWIYQEYGYMSGRKAAIKEFCRNYGKIDVMIGIAGDETKRAVGNNKGPVWMQHCINKIYPLIDLNMDRAACQQVIEKYGGQVPLPSNCKICPFMSDVELLWLYTFYPDDYKQWVEIEKVKLAKHRDKGRKNLPVWGRYGETLDVVLKKAIKEYSSWSEDKLWQYKMTHGHCNMSLY
jgi:hypothetical protein